jgi:hypothetical protein
MQLVAQWRESIHAVARRLSRGGRFSPRSCALYGILAVSCPETGTGIAPSGEGTTRRVAWDRWGLPL